MHQSNPFTNTSINASSVRETLEDYQALWESDRDIRFVIEIVTETLWDDFDPTGVAKVSDSVISKVRSVPQLCKDDAEDDRAAEEEAIKQHRKRQRQQRADEEAKKLERLRREAAGEEVEEEEGGKDDDQRKVEASLANYRPEEDVSAFTGLAAFAKRFVAVCPLVAAFKQPCFQERHWRELVNQIVLFGEEHRIARRKFVNPNEDEDALLRPFFAQKSGLQDKWSRPAGDNGEKDEEEEEEPPGLALYRHVAKVEALIDKAEQELKQREILQAIDERWRRAKFLGSVVAALLAPTGAGGNTAAPTEAEALDQGKKDKKNKKKKKKKGGDGGAAAQLLPTLELSAKDKEDLRHDLILLADIQGSRYKLFHSAADSWATRLRTVTEVLAAAAANAALATFLYPLYTKSK